MILNIPGVIHLFVALLGPILGVLLGILVSPKTLMEILIGGVSEPLNLFPEFFRGERKHPVFGLQAMAMEAYSLVEDLDRVHTRQPPQRTQPKTDAGGTRQGQPHRGAPNGYDAERAQRPCLGGGQRQAQ